MNLDSSKKKLDLDLHLPNLLKRQEEDEVLYITLVNSFQSHIHTLKTLILAL